MNQSLGNVGTTVTYAPAIEASPTDQAASLRDLVRAMDAGQVELLVILGGVNPVFTAPADLKFAEKLAKVDLAVYHGLYADETAYLCHWNIPEAHALESWGDARAYDGTVTVMQPLIAPLYEGRSAQRSARALHARRPDRRGYAIVKDYWTRAYAGDRLDDPITDAQPFKNADTLLEARAARRVHRRHRDRRRRTGDTVCRRSRACVGIARRGWGRSGRRDCRAKRAGATSEPAQ